MVHCGAAIKREEKEEEEVNNLMMGIE